MTPFPSTILPQKSGIDWNLWCATGGLMLVGAAFIFSATGYQETARGIPWYNWTAFRQAVAYAIGLGLVVGLNLIDYSRLARWSLLSYWISIGLLICVSLFGTSRHGARRWLDLGPIQFQPSELAKLTFLFALSVFLCRPTSELRSPTIFLKGLGLALLPFALVLKQPDLGSALVFLPATLVMMLVAGVPRNFIVKLIGGALVLLSLILVDVLLAPPNWRLIQLQEYQRHRLLVYFDADFAPSNANAEDRLRAAQLKRKTSWNVEQAMISVGSGGLTGKGWHQGTQHRLGYLPRLGAHNDFIFSVIAEEKGFLGSLTVLGLYSVILFIGIRIASDARDRLGCLLASGVVTLLFTHVFVNIGMNIRLMPVTGIPLPLLSAGGTSVICSLVALGILQNVYLYRRRY